MKIRILLLIAFFSTLRVTRALAQDSLIKHSVYVAPFVGLNSTIKAPVYGAEVGYEFRLNKHLGLTGGLNIAYTQKNNPAIYDGNNGGNQAINSKLLQNAFYAGAKYYIGNFYVSADFGYQDAYLTINHKYLGTGSSYNYGTYASNGFYRAYGLGYQMPLKKGDNIEIFTKGSNANSNTYYAIGFKYNFGLFKRK
ncbi:hypothetical protein [Pedobacter agri]|uniref:hypothetical protein n=1 Tax=Pedobacter agri TaxID=454586 RepID=UPI002931B016|nr:hypothetical protein [Pedobacter agri]